MKKGIVISLATLVILAIAGVAFCFLNREADNKEHQNKIETISSRANDIVTDVQSKVASKAPLVWVYDRDENFIMTLKVSAVVGSIDSIPDVLLECIRAEGDVYHLAAKLFLSDSGIDDPDIIEGYSYRLRQDFTDDIVARYYVVSCEYAGRYTGIVNAAIGLFGREPERLTDVQLRYLAYSMNNKGATFEEFCRINDVSLDLVTADCAGRHESLRLEVISELQRILGDSITEKNYSVKLSYSVSQSLSLQAIVDRECRSFTQLATDGTYAVDCSVVAIDRETGLVRLFVPGRSGIGKSQRLLEMESENLIPCLKELQNRVGAGMLKNSLVEVVQANGDVNLYSLEELFESLTLSSADDDRDVGRVSASSLVSAVFDTSPDDIHLVYQILSDNAKVYEATPDSKIDFKHTGLYEFFSTDSEEQLTGHFSRDLHSGSVDVYFTADYIVASIIGSGAIGVEVPQAQYDLFHSIVGNIRGAVSAGYPTPKNKMWDSAEVEVIRQSVYASNIQYVVSIFEQRFEKLTSITIDSPSSRLQFEDEYANMLKLVSDYESYVGLSCAEDLRGRLSALWVERSPLLMQYSV